jgi:hypothetical protein
MTEYISATPEPPAPPRGRPSALWFLVGGLLVAAGVAAGIVLFLRIFDSGFLDVDATVPPDGEVHRVTVDPGTDRYLWARQDGSTDCVVLDAATGGAITLGSVDGRVTRTADGDSWQAVASFDPGSGSLAVTCSPEAGPAQIGPSLDVGDFVGRILVAILVPLVLVGLGLAALIGTAVLWATRPKPVS